MKIWNETHAVRHDFFGRALSTQHRQGRNKRIYDRFKAVRLLDKGWSAVSIAEAHLLFEDSIRDCISE